MCEICDGAKSTSEMPCSKVLTDFGKILYQVVGDGPAAQMAMQTTGGLHSPSEKGREVYGNLLYGIHLGRAEEIRTERKQHRRDRWFAVRAGSLVRETGSSGLWLNFPTLNSAAYKQNWY